MYHIKFLAEPEPNTDHHYWYVFEDEACVGGPYMSENRAKKVVARIDYQGAGNEKETGSSGGGGTKPGARKVKRSGSRLGEVGRV